MDKVTIKMKEVGKGFFICDIFVGFKIKLISWISSGFKLNVIVKTSKLFN